MSSTVEAERCGSFNITDYGSIAWKHNFNDNDDYESLNCLMKSLSIINKNYYLKGLNYREPWIIGTLL